MRNISITQSFPKNSANSRGGLPQILSSVRSWPSECWQWLWLVPILQDDPTKRWLLDRLLPPLSDCRLESRARPWPAPMPVSLGERYMPTDIHERAPGLWPRFVGLLAAIRWEAQFKLAKCCMRASISMSDLGVFLAEPVLARYQTLNGGEVHKDAVISFIVPNPLPPLAAPPRTPGSSS